MTNFGEKYNTYVLQELSPALSTLEKNVETIILMEIIKNKFFTNAIIEIEFH